MPALTGRRNESYSPSPKAPGTHWYQCPTIATARRRQPRQTFQNLEIAVNDRLSYDVDVGLTDVGVSHQRVRLDDQMRHYLTPGAPGAARVKNAFPPPSYVS